MNIMGMIFVIGFVLVVGFGWWWIERQENDPWADLAHIARKHKPNVWEEVGRIIERREPLS